MARKRRNDHGESSVPDDTSESAMGRQVDDGSMAPDEMTETPEYISFGQYLTRAREARGLSLDDLAHQTKIRKAILEALEHNAKRDLPEKVFILGYVRSYAIAVGLNVEDTIHKFSAAWGDEGTAVEIEEAKAASRSYAWVVPTIATLIALLALWIIIRMH
jgi:cytoskeletal protein RodZ